jgi:type I restriction enzyme S subunit
MREGWTVKRIEDVADTRLGKTLPQGAGRVDGGQRYLRNVNVRWGQITTDDLNTMDFSEHEQRDLELRAGDVVVCEGGEVGRCALIAEDMPGVYFQNALHRLRSNGTVVPAFLAYTIENLVSSGGLEGVTSQVTIAHLNQAKLRAIELLIPPLSEQQRIVDLIESLDATIEAADESAGALDHAYLALLERVNNSGFELRRLESVLSKAKAGGTPSRTVPKNYGGSIPWLKSGEVENDSIITSSESITEFALASSSAWLAPAGATVVAMYGQGDTKGKAGFLLAPVAMNQAVIALVPNEEIIDGRFLFHVMRSRTGSLRKKAVGAAQPNLSKGIVLDEEIPLPPLSAQPGISSMLDSALDSRRLAELHAASLRNLRTNLLTTLLSGAHEIPESYDDQLPEAV